VAGVGFATGVGGALGKKEVVESGGCRSRMLSNAPQGNG